MQLRPIIVIALLALSLTACGKRGALEHPPGVAVSDPDEPAAIDPLIKPD